MRAGERLNADQAVRSWRSTPKGGASFQALQHRGTHPGHQIVFYAFDVVRLDGRDLTGEPLLKRPASFRNCWTVPIRSPRTRC